MVEEEDSVEIEKVDLAEEEGKKVQVQVAVLKAAKNFSFN
jgi:hypothetical protein